MNSKQIRLREGVQITPGNANTALLYAEGCLTPMQLGSSFWAIASLLKHGTTRDIIIEELGNYYESQFSSQTSDAVDSLLDQLKDNGYLDSAVNQKQAKQVAGTRPLYWSGLDKALTLFMKYWPKPSLQIELIIVSVVLALSLMVVTSFFVSEIEFIQSLFTLQSLNFAWLFVALLIFYLVFMPMHELAHGLAAKSAGIPVTGCGMFVKWFVFPGFFVEMRGVLGVTSLYKKILIPLAGIIMDMFLIALLTAILSSGYLSSTVESLLGYLFCIALFVAANNLNPMINTDGAKCLAAVFNDYAILDGAFKGKRSVHSSEAKLWCYRMIGIVYVLVFLIVIYQIIVR